jgi:hypothetical protein
MPADQGVPKVSVHAEAEELPRIKDNTLSEMKTGPGQGKALETINHHESL